VRVHRVGLTVLMATIFVGSVLFASTAGATDNSSLGTASAKPVNGGNLVVEVNATWLSLDPDSPRGITIPLPVFQTLFTQESNNAITSDLALSYKFTNAGLTFVMTLRKGVSYQDGTPFNAQSAVFDLQRSFAAGTDCDGYVNGAVSNVVATGPYTVALTLTRRDAALPYVLANQYCGYMMSPTSVSTYGATVALHPVGTGPFVYASGVAGNTAILNRWSGYWGPKAHLASVTIEATPVEASEWTNLQSGQADVWSVADGVTYASQSKAAGFNVVRTAAASNNYLEISTTTAPFNNILARKAVIEAINVKTILKNVFQSEVTPVAGGPLPPAMLGFQKVVPGAVSYNPAGAEKLVQELGGSLTFTLAYMSGSSLLALLVTVEQQMLNAIPGMHVTLLPQTSAIFLQQEFTHSYQLQQTIGGSTNGDPDLLFATRFFSTAPDNEFGLMNSTVDKYIIQGEAIYNTAARAKIYQKLNDYLATKILCQDQIGSNPEFYISLKSVHNYTPNPYGWFDWSSVWMS